MCESAGSVARFLANPNECVSAPRNGHLACLEKVWAGLDTTHDDVPVGRDMQPADRVGRSLTRWPHERSEGLGIKRLPLGHGKRGEQRAMFGRPEIDLGTLAGRAHVTQDRDHDGATIEARVGRHQLLRTASDYGADATRWGPPE
jgi:hypothetical protein